MKSNLAHKQEVNNEISLHPSTAKKLEQEAMSKKEEGYTRTPNSLIDEQIMAHLSDKAFKCLMLIVRQTVGFDRLTHTIATTQFQKFCGIKKEETVAKVIRELEDCKLIAVVRKKGCLNNYTPTISQYHQKVVPPSKGSTPIRGGGSTTIEKGYTTPIKGGTTKETLKENIKEIHTQENSAQKLGDESWKPNLDLLSSILRTTKHSQRVSEILGMIDFEFHLGNFNAHWEDKITLTENQKTRKFVSWITQEFEKSERKVRTTEKQNNFDSKPKTALQATKDQWAGERFAEQQNSNVIDVNQDQVLIGGEREYF